MVAQFRLSRRYVLGVTAAVGGLAMSGGIARGQSTARIEKLAPEVDKIISTSDPVQHLAADPGRSRANSVVDRQSRRKRSGPACDFRCCSEACGSAPCLNKWALRRLKRGCAASPRMTKNSCPRTRLFSIADAGHCDKSSAAQAAPLSGNGVTCPRRNRHSALPFHAYRFRAIRPLFRGDGDEIKARG